MQPPPCCPRETRVELACSLLATRPPAGLLGRPGGPRRPAPPVIGRPDRVVLQGRVLKEAPSQGSSVLSRNLRRLTAPNWEGAKVEVSFLGVRTTVTSGHDGELRGEPAAARGHHVPRRLLRGRGEGVRRPVPARGSRWWRTPPRSSSSRTSMTRWRSRNVIKPAKLMENALLKDSDSAGGGARHGGLLRVPEGPQRRPAFALVSGSPVQFGSRVNAFLARHGFPAFGVYLRDLGPEHAVRLQAARHPPAAAPVPPAGGAGGGLGREGSGGVRADPRRVPRAGEGHLHP